GGMGGTNLRAVTSRGPMVVKVRPDPRSLRVMRAAAGILTQRGIPHADVLLPSTRTADGWLLGLRWVDGDPLSDLPVSDWSPARAARFGTELGTWMRRLHSIRVPNASWSRLANQWYRGRAALVHEVGLIVGRLAARMAQAWEAYQPALAD